MRAVCTTCTEPTEVALRKGERLADFVCDCGGSLARPRGHSCANCGRRTSHVAATAWLNDRTGIVYPAGTPGCLPCGVFCDLDYFTENLTRATARHETLIAQQIQGTVTSRALDIQARRIAELAAGVEVLTATSSAPVSSGR